LSSFALSLVKTCCGQGRGEGPLPRRCSWRDAAAAPLLDRAATVGHGPSGIRCGVCQPEHPPTRGAPHKWVTYSQEPPQWQHFTLSRHPVWSSGDASLSPIHPGKKALVKFTNRYVHVPFHSLAFSELLTRNL